MDDSAFYYELYKKYNGLNKDVRSKEVRQLDLIEDKSKDEKKIKKRFIKIEGIRNTEHTSRPKLFKSRDSKNAESKDSIRLNNSPFSKLLSERIHKAEKKERFDNDKDHKKHHTSKANINLDNNLRNDMMLNVVFKDQSRNTHLALLRPKQYEEDSLLETNSKLNKNSNKLCISPKIENFTYIGSLKQTNLEVKQMNKSNNNEILDAQVVNPLKSSAQTNNPNIEQNLENRDSSFDSEGESKLQQKNKVNDKVAIQVLPNIVIQQDETPVQDVVYNQNHKIQKLQILDEDKIKNVDKPCRSTAVKDLQTTNRNNLCVLSHDDEAEKELISINSKNTFSIKFNNSIGSLPGNMEISIRKAGQPKISALSTSKLEGQNYQKPKKNKKKNGILACFTLCH